MSSSDVASTDTSGQHRPQAAPSPGRARLLDLAGLAARLVLGAVLIWAGLSKVTRLQDSVRAVMAYRLFSYDVGHLIGTLLPIIEIIVGILLVLALFTRAAAVVGGLLMVAFIIGIASVWARGLSIDCGCFGGGGTIDKAQTHYLREILRDTGLLICAAWLVWRPRSAYGLDQRLFG